MEWAATLLTLRLACWTTAVLAVVGLPLACWLTWHRRRWTFLVEAVVALPLVLPPTVIGFYLLMALGPRGWPGSWWMAATGEPLPFTFAGMLAGSIVFNLPFAVRPFMSGFASVDRRLVEAAWSLGVSRAYAFRRVVLPLAWPGIFSGLVLTFAHTLGEFGVVLMLGGNIPGATQTLSTLIYDDVQALDYAAAHRTAAGLLMCAFAVLGVVMARQRRAMPL